MLDLIFTPAENAHLLFFINHAHSKFPDHSYGLFFNIKQDGSKTCCEDRRQDSCGFYQTEDVTSCLIKNNWDFSCKNSVINNI